MCVTVRERAHEGGRVCVYLCFYNYIAILLVGYGVEKSLFGTKPYWLIKNR